jgi:hypothetical protein
VTDTLLVLAPGSNRRGFPERTGDLFDMALVETIRTLDGPGGDVEVLVPWEADLAALTAAAALDTAPSFDPEASTELAASRSRLTPYTPPGESPVEENDPFWLASHMALSASRPGPLSEALARATKVTVIVLGLPRRPAMVRKMLRGHEVKVLTFASLVGVEEAARALGVGPDRVVDLEERAPVRSEADDVERSREFVTETGGEAGLERYVAFSILLQDVFDPILPEEEFRDR